MISSRFQTEMLAGLKDGSIVPYLGPGVLADVRHAETGVPMPATSDELIIAMNGGKPMSPKLMYEFPRAAMNIELKRGRSAVTKFLDATYNAPWTRSAVHDWLKAIKPAYVIDINRDTQLLDSYADVPHTLVLGCARLGGTDFRFKLFAWDGKHYTAILPGQAALGLPLLFKPMGSPQAGIDLHRLRRRLRRLHHRADGRLRRAGLRQAIAPATSATSSSACASTATASAW